MRAEVLEKVAPVKYILNGSVFEESNFISDDPECQVKEAKIQYMKVVGIISEAQKADKTIGDGYILFLDHIYKVYACNAVVCKITGEEAKNAKRKMKN